VWGCVCYDVTAVTPPLRHLASPSRRLTRHVSIFRPDRRSGRLRSAPTAFTATRAPRWVRVGAILTGGGGCTRSASIRGAARASLLCSAPVPLPWWRARPASRADAPGVRGSSLRWPARPSTALRVQLRVQQTSHNWVVRTGTRLTDGHGTGRISPAQRAWPCTVLHLLA